jgi:hypothetical protein
MGYIFIVPKFMPCLFLTVASFLRSQLATFVVRALNRSIADDTLDTLVA